METAKLDRPGGCAVAASRGAWGFGIALLLIAIARLLVEPLAFPPESLVLPLAARMKLNTAVLFGLLGSAVVAFSYQRQRVGYALAGSGVVLALATLSQDFLDVSLGIDEAFARDVHPPSLDGAPGRMAPASSLGFVLGGVGLVMLAAGSGSRLVGTGQFLSLASGLIAGVALVGYLFGEALLYHGTWHTAISLPTALGFLFLCIATLSLRPGEGLLAPFRADSIGGAMARRVLPAILLLTPALGWLTLVGQRRFWFDPDLGVALLVTGLALTLTIVLWFNARLLNRVASAHSHAVAGARQMELRRSAVVESAFDAIITVDERQRIVEFNAAAEKMFGRTRASVLGGPLDPLLPVRAASGRRDMIGEFGGGGGAARGMGELGMVRGRRADGTEFSVEASVSQIRIGGALFCTAIIRDISARLEAEELLRRENQFREHVIENAGLAVISVDTTGSYLMVSPRFCEIIGRTMEQTLGTSFRELVYPDDLAYAEAMTARILEGESFRSLQIRMRRSIGGAVPMIWSASPIREGDRITGVLATGIDLTEHARLEEELRQAQKLESVGQLASGIAHDFNNLLTAILGNSNLLVDELRDNFAAEERVRHVIAASERAAALTGQLLAFSRKKAAAPKVINLNRLVADVMPMLRRLIRSDIEISFRACPELGNALVDPNHFEQVLINLVVNARDAMPSGGVVSIETDNVMTSETYAINPSEMRPGRHVMLAVSDTGIGMDDATRARIFEPFFTTKEQGKGTGLGLATCYGIVKQARGDIGVYSEPGRGTTFKVLLPRVDEPATAEGAARPVRPTPRGEGTILVAEDEEMVRRIVAESLRAVGYTVLEACDGLEALSISDCHVGPLDLLITDAVMPRMNGRQLYDQIRAGRNGLRVMFMSGYTADASVRGGGVEGEVSFLSKPFSPRQLLERVQAMLST